MDTKDYLPINVEFDIEEQNLVPNSLGTFKTLEEVSEFINDKKLVVINQALDVTRLMDNFEKSEIRREYENILENTLPEYERELAEKQAELERAKTAMKQAQENVNAQLNQARTLAAEVKRGVVLIKLDDVRTFRIPVRDKYYLYTFISNELKLCRTENIPEDEKQHVFNSSRNNEEILINGEIATQEGQEEQLLKVAQ